MIHPLSHLLSTAIGKPVNTFKMAEYGGEGALRPDFYAFPIDHNETRSVRLLYDRLFDEIFF